MTGNDTVFLEAIKMNYMLKKIVFLACYVSNFYTSLQGECVRIGITNCH